MEELLYCENCDRDNVRDPDAERCSRCQLEHDSDGSEPIEASTAPDAPIEFRLTFGQQYPREPHPSGFAAHRNGWLTVLAVDETAARRGVIAAITNAWSSIYGPADRGYPQVGTYYPLGEIGRIEIVSGPDDEPVWRWLRQTAGGDWEPKPVVWAAGWRSGPIGDQAWVALAEDGRIVTQHVSSSRDWGIRDVGPTGMHATDYVAAFGSADVDYRVVPEGGNFPVHVIDAHQAWLGTQHAEPAPPVTP